MKKKKSVWSVIACMTNMHKFSGFRSCCLGNNFFVRTPIRVFLDSMTISWSQESSH